jgi:hypothetical protein
MALVIPRTASLPYFVVGRLRRFANREKRTSGATTRRGRSMWQPDL